MQNREMVIKIFAAVIISYFFMAIFLPKICGIDKYKSYVLDDYITNVDIVKADGSTEHYNDRFFKVVNAGDILTVSVDIPEKMRVENPSLCFSVDHCIIDIYYGDTCIYSYAHERAESQKQIGKCNIITELPDDCWGNKVTIVLQVTENKSFSRLNDFVVLPSSQSYKYIFINNMAEFVFFSMIALLSIVCLFGMILSGRFTKSSVRQLIYIAFFGLAVSIWILAYYRMLRFYIGNDYICADLEYIALFIMPVPAGAYFWETEKNKIVKHILGIYTLILALYFIVCTILNYTTSVAHYCQNITKLHMLIAAGGIIIIINCFKDHREQSKVKSIMKYSFLFLITAGVIDVIRYNVDKYFGVRNPIFTFSIMPIGVMIFIGGLIASSILTFKMSLVFEKDKRQLERLAYMDTMTGLANRSECDITINKLKNSNIKDYSIAFFDLNELKKCNDVYGHDSGDAYIKAVTSALLSSFGTDNFCGRMGGDEFIAILYNKKSKYILEYISDFDNKIDNLNKMGILKIKASVARGIAVSSKKIPLDVEEAIKMADNMMYENKKEQKRVR